MNFHNDKLCFEFEEERSVIAKSNDLMWKSMNIKHPCSAAVKSGKGRYCKKEHFTIQIKCMMLQDPAIHKG